MLQYIVKRIVAMVITLFIIISLSFFAIRLIPGDVAGENAAPEIKEAMEARYHLFYPQLGVKLCSMAGGGVQKSIWCF